LKLFGNGLRKILGERERGKIFFGKKNSKEKNPKNPVFGKIPEGGKPQKKVFNFKSFLGFLKKNF
jgi:hypothetical protein